MERCRRAPSSSHRRTSFGATMIRVTVEMLPGGVDMGPGENEILGVMLITNNIAKSIQTGGKRGDYGVHLWKKRNAANVIAANQLGSGLDYDPAYKVEVTDFPRNSYHVWNLVRKALTEIAAIRGSI